jgi:putative membrane protein
MSAQVKRLLLVVISTSILSQVSLATAADTRPSEADRAFMAKAAQGGRLEVAAGKLAAQRGLALAVKAFGQQMVTDHTAANDKLKALADSKQLPLPDALSPEESTALGKLETLSGTQFDQAYAKMMIKDHMEDISELENEIKQGQDRDVKAFASSTLPILRQHLEMAKNLRSQEKKSP